MYKTYKKYKPSGVEWIGEIPIHWKKIKFKYVTSLMTCGHAATPSYVEESNGFPFLSAQNIKSEKIDLFQFRYISQELHNSLTKNHKVEKGDLLQVRVGGESTVGQTAIVEIDFPFSIYVSLSHIKLKSTVFNGYIKYLCNSTNYRKYSSLIMKKGAGVANFNVSDQEKIKIPFPIKSEQIEISNYLDKKTTQIDELIAKKERLIELLEEEKTAVINEAVTKGIDPNAKLKDSGIEWLGEIPEHWQTLPLKRTVANKITDGPHETPTFVDEGVPFLSAEAVKNNKLDFDFRRGNISYEEDARYSLKCKPQSRDLLFVKSGSTTGKVAIVETNINFNIWSPLALIRVNKLFEPYFLFFIIQSNYFQRSVQLFWSFGTQPNIGMNVIETLIVAFPKIDEQRIIVKYINKEIIRIEKTIETTKKLIELLKEYRTALISEAVTGKIDVRDCHG